MIKPCRYLVSGGAVALALLLSRGYISSSATEEELARHRNLGKAYYETPTALPQAVEEFRRALQLLPKSDRDRLNYGMALFRAGQIKEAVAEMERAQKQNPALPHSWFNLGVAYKRLGRYPEAIAQFERFVKLVPDEPVAHYNLGLIHNISGETERALAYFRKASQLNPRLVAPKFQIYNIYRLAEKEEEAARALAIFQEAKQQQKDADEEEDMEWCFYAEIYDPLEARPRAPAAPKPPALKFAARTPAGRVEPSSAGLRVFDADGDGRADLAAWSASGIVLLRSADTPLADTGLGHLKGVMHLAPGDFDNDGLADLCVVTAKGAALYRNQKGRFIPHGAALAGSGFRYAVWLDYDHDYDLDLILLGSAPKLYRNQGAAADKPVDEAARFRERTSDFPFVPGTPTGAVLFRRIPDTKGFDLIVTYKDRSGVLYEDRLGGKYSAVPIEHIPAGARLPIAADLDNDSWLDLAFDHDKGFSILRNARGVFRDLRHLEGLRGGYAFADLTNVGVLDAIVGKTALRHLGYLKYDPWNPPVELPSGLAWAAADFDMDGRTDLAAIAADGSLRLLRNQTQTPNQWLAVNLTGVKNLKLSPGAEVEVRAGGDYQKQLYQGAPLVFGLGSRKLVDAVRITWANGMIQNVTNQAAGRAETYREAPRLAGSCPMIFTWNGSRFEFITDVLGVAPLGASAGDGSYFPVDHDEYIQIPGRSLVPVEGRYSIRITEELREVSYLDQVQLIAADHPADLQVFTNDKFKAPPYPEFRLFGVTRRIHPVRASDHRGRDVLAAVLQSDRRYPSGFNRDYAGLAELHHLDLDFGEAARGNRAILVLKGWVDWADGSTFVRAAQGGRGGLVFPHLQVKDASGNWKTVVEDMGIPAGKPKTIVADLTGKFLSPAREVRIVTNLCLYWDEIFLSEDESAPAVRLTRLPARHADLRYRGFSKPVIHPRRMQPESFEYQQVSLTSTWNPAVGRYTRFGEVTELLHRPDDRMVIMGSGDELQLSFEAAALPALPPGWTRDFLLLVDGWAKDGDANTAFSQTVEPLPFHGMSAYPYPRHERFPTSPEHQAWQQQYLTRESARLLPALALRR